MQILSEYSTLHLVIAFRAHHRSQVNFHSYVPHDCFSKILDKHELHQICNITFMKLCTAKPGFGKQSEKCEHRSFQAGHHVNWLYKHVFPMILKLKRSSIEAEM